MHEGAWANFPSLTLDLRTRFGTGGGWNGPGYSDPALDKKFDDQLAELDPARRAEMLKDIQRELFTDVLTYIPTTRPISISLRQPYLRNVFWTAYSSYESNSTLWLDL